MVADGAVLEFNLKRLVEGEDDDDDEVSVSMNDVTFVVGDTEEDSLAATADVAQLLPLDSKKVKRLHFSLLPSMVEWVLYPVFQRLHYYSMATPL